MTDYQKQVNSNWTQHDYASAYQEALDKHSRKAKDPLGTRFIHWGYKHIGKPFIFSMEPDKAHAFTVDSCHALSTAGPLMGLLHDITDNSSPELSVRAMGLEYGSPFGLAAGLDKDGKLLRILDAAGFGFCSYGSMTSRPCAGNERPWFKRYPEYQSMGIHAGIPNPGADVVTRDADAEQTPYGAMRHASVAFTNTSYPDGIDGMIADFRDGVQVVMNSITDVCEVNVSCPNLQAGKPFKDPAALDALFDVLDDVFPQSNGVNQKNRKPVMVKMPNATPGELDGMLDVLASHNVQGLALCNLLEDKTGYPDAADWPGGLSGTPCHGPAMEAVRFVRSGYESRFAIEGVGGVMSPMDAMMMLDAGADLVGFVSTLMFNGPQMASEFKTAYAAALDVMEAKAWSHQPIDL